MFYNKVNFVAGYYNDLHKWRAKQKNGYLIGIFLLYRNEESFRLFYFLLVLSCFIALLTIFYI